MKEKQIRESEIKYLEDFTKETSEIQCYKIMH